MNFPRIFSLLLLLFFSELEHAHANSVHEACKRLCETESDCLRRCVSHAELMELKADLIHAATDFTSSVDNRLKVLRSGANLEILSLCRSTGWSLENMLICLRSYPTPELIKECKNLSPLQEEQVRCVRSGKSTAEVEACSLLFVGADQRLRCLEMAVTAQETRTCRAAGGNSTSRMNCLNQVLGERLEETMQVELEARKREAREKELRVPASQRNEEH